MNRHNPHQQHQQFSASPQAQPQVQHQYIDPHSGSSPPASMSVSATAAAAAAASTISGARETGVVMAVKDAYGFIRCAQREDKVFFHFSELLNASNEREIDRGDEVAFTVIYEEDSARFSGVQVELLAPGSVVFEDISTNVSIGVIERELQGQQRVYGRRTARLQQEPFGGRIRCFIADCPGLNNNDIVQFISDKEVLLEFSGRDVEDPRVVLQQGDQVSFRLFTELRSGRQGATAVALVKPTGNRETGVVVSVKESYGFLKCADRDHKQMFFHYTELLDPDAQIQPGVGLEFEVALNKKGQLHATRVLVLEPGSVSFSVVEPESVSGVISQPIKHMRTPSGKTRRTSRPGSRDVGFVKVVLDSNGGADADAASGAVDATSASAPVSRIISPQHDEEKDNNGGSDAIPKPKHEKTLSFCGTDLIYPRIELMEGDRVTFKVAVDKRTRALSATEVVLVQPCAVGRERGIISVVKPQYGFIRCEKRSEPLFFHFNEFVGADYAPQLGDEIEFNVHPDNRGQDNATRITLLPQGSVVFEFLDLTGIVVAAPGAVSVNDRASVDGSADDGSASANTLNAVDGDGDSGFGSVQLSPESIKQLESQMASASIISGDVHVMPSVLGHDHSYPFGLVNLLTPKTALRVGDEVSFVFRRDAQGDSPRISSLRLVPKHGVVETVTNSGGTIRLSDSEPNEVVGFSAKDVANNVILRVGDEIVAQTLTFNARFRQRTARLVERTKQAPMDVVEPLPKRNEGLQKRVASANRVRQIVRMARGPDGTRGFTAGRGTVAAAATPSA